MDELHKLGDERRRGLLTLEALRTGGASIAILDAQLGQVEKVLQVISKGDDLRDRCILDIFKSQEVGNAQGKKIEELQNVVAKLEAKVVLLDARLRESEKTDGVQNSRSRTTSTNADVVDSAHNRRGSGSCANSGAAVMFAAAVKGVKEPLNQRAGDSFKERVRHMSREASSVTETHVDTAADDHFDQVITDMDTNWRAGATATALKPNAPEFRPLNQDANVRNSATNTETDVIKRSSVPEFQEPLALEPPKLFKPKMTTASSEFTSSKKYAEPVTIQTEKIVCTEKEAANGDDQKVGIGLGFTGDESRNSNVDRAYSKPMEFASASTEKEAVVCSIEDDEEVHPDETIIREAFLKPMFEEPVGLTAAVVDFIDRIRDDLETTDWAPFMKVLTEMGTEARAKATKAFEIYEVFVNALASEDRDQDVKYLRKPLLQRCQKMFKKTLNAVKTNYVNQDNLEATLWFLARLYYWENFGNRREVLGLAVCEMLAQLAKKTVRDMSIADSLTTIKELLEFMMPRLKKDNDPKLEKQILEISEAVVAQLSSFGPRMYKEQELARNILKYVDSLVKNADENEVVEWA